MHARTQKKKPQQQQKKQQQQKSHSQQKRKVATTASHRSTSTTSRSSSLKSPSAAKKSTSLSKSQKDLNARNNARALHTQRRQQQLVAAGQKKPSSKSHSTKMPIPAKKIHSPQQQQFQNLSTQRSQQQQIKAALDSRRAAFHKEIAKLGLPTFGSSLATTTKTTQQTSQQLSSPLQYISTRDITTIPTSPLQSTLLSSKHPALRSLASSKLSLTPHPQQLTQSSLDLVPVFMPLRGFAAEKKPAAKAKAGIKKKPEMEEAEGGDEAFAQAGDVKKNLRNWLEQILTSKPEIDEMPQAAIDNEELFVKECQTRFAQRLDQRSRYEQAKIILKQRAIEQLPGELKTAALKEDPALWSMQIMTPWSDPPRKKWLMEHYRIPYKASQEEIDEEEFLKKKYARL